MTTKKWKDRYSISVFVFLIAFAIIIFRLATIMIVMGEQYREQAENRIYKSIPLSAARGEIRDRYGRLLAGNRPSFTVQIMKNEVVDEKINEVSLNLINILEANQDRYNDDFPIIFTEDGEYVFIYDLEIENWKIRNNLEDARNAKEAFEILRIRYDIQETDPFEVQQQFIKIPDLHVPISIYRWQFTDEIRKNNWLSNYRIQDIDISAYDAFQKIKQNIYRIPKAYSDKDARKIMVIREQLRKQGYLQYQPAKIAQDISFESVTNIEENILEFPGVSISVEPIRYYPGGKTASHILGTLGKISQPNEIERFINELNYLPSDIIGKTGIEHKFEEILRGQNGHQNVIVDSRGRLINVLEREEPVPGDTLYLTIDANLQRVAEDVLGEVLLTMQEGGTYETPWGRNRLATTNGPISNATSGSVVIQDVKTGEILALANYPSYDPNLFATGISTQDWRNLMPENERDPLAPRPLLNIAMSTAIQPGSTFKMLVGLAALEQGLSPKYQILDRGFIQVGGHSFGNWLWNRSRRTMGYQNLYQAIADSNNFYFYSLATGYDYGAARPLPMEMTVETLIDYTKKFGLNDRTGIEIDIPRERSGGVPSIENKTRTIKIMLERNLKRTMKLEDLDSDKVEVNQENLDGIITEIISWAEENPTRAEIYRRMVRLGISEEKVNTYTDTVKYSYFNQARWTIADTMNFSIGQGEHMYTPLQMTNYMAILANGGYRYNVSVVRKSQSYHGENVVEYPPELIEKIELKDYSNIEHVNLGMYEATATGPARTYFNIFPIKVAGKTGTAQREGKIPPLDEVEYLLRNLRNFQLDAETVQNKTEELMHMYKDDIRFQDKGHAMREAIKLLNPRIKNVDLDQFKENYDNFAWFTGFAPYEDPKIAISVIIFQGNSGGFGAPIFREVVAEYMGLNQNSKENEVAIRSRFVP